MNGEESAKIKALEVGQKYIKEDVAEVKKDVKTIITNDLPHLKENIADNANELKILAVKLSVSIAIIVFVITLLGTKLVDLIIS